MRRATVFLALIVAVATVAQAAESTSRRHGLPPPGAAATLALPPLDAGKALAEDAAVAGKGLPLRYAVTHAVAVDPHAGGKAARGEWHTLADGRLLWRLAIEVPNALSIDLGFARMHLPHGAALTLVDAAGTTLRGPWTDADNTPHGAFYTPFVPGDRALLELVLPAAQKDALRLELGRVHAAYRDILTGISPQEKSGSCNVDTVCPEGDGYRNQIAAVARITFSGSLCSGQLVANTARDNRRYFTTANHCVSTQADASSVVAYWRYENPTCRTPGSAQSAVPIPTSGNSVVQTGGATLRATHADSDTTLMELVSAIPDAAQPYFNGWDRRDIAHSSAVVVHHPQGHEKRISFENNPLSITETGSPGVPGLRHFRVADWDLGTTEQGSSGSALLSPEKRVIGFLSGGSALCGNNLEDYFGRLPVAWEGGGTPASRLRDWLDPSGSGASFLDGAGSCDAPSLALTASADPAPAGDPVTLSLAITGGTGPYRVDWDLDGDGVIDRTASGVGANASLAPSWPARTVTTIVARVTDATGCTASVQRALTVRGPQIVVEALEGFSQLCGDGDAAPDGNERFEAIFRLRNAGDAALDAGHAIFTKAPTEAAQTTLGPDGFGYRGADDAGGCSFQFVDIAASASVQALTAAGAAAAAEDDGRTAAIAVSPFAFYGATVSSLVMSTNGYLSTGAADSGGDFDNACGLGLPDRGSVGGRINVLHDDLVVGAGVGAGLRQQSFAACPRRAESATGDTPCHVFQWSRMGTFSQGGAVGDFDFQAIVYPATGQIVYQYRDDGPAGAGSIGIQNATATQGLEYACNDSGAAVAGRAVCLFHPQAGPLAGVDARLRLENPAVALPALAPGATASAALRFAFDGNAPAGAPFRIDYVGAVDAKRHSMESTSVLSGTTGAPNAGSCPAQIAAIAPRDGLFANANRFGNGIASYNIPSGGGTVFGGQWFTGAADRTPTWLILQGAIADNQANVPVLRFRQTGDAPFAVTNTIAGRAQITYLSPTEYVATWSVDGRAAGERLQLLYGTTRPTPNRTGAWLFPAEAGWGQAVDDHILPNGQPEQVIVNYLYDGDGEPIWTLGGASNLQSGTVGHNLFLVHPPGGAALGDFLATQSPAGTVSYSYSSLTQGTYSTALDFSPLRPGGWQRTSVPIQMISQPVPQR